MTKDEISNIIFKLQNNEEIVDFINKRLASLELTSVEKTVGQNYTDSFRDYISSKTHYKTVENFSDTESPDLVYDDILPYYNLIMSLKEDGWYNILSLFTTIFFLIDEYLPNDDMMGLGRFFVYSANKGKRVSIKTIREKEVAFCSEKAGLAHNIFKFLGFDSEVVFGARDNEMHAYNFVYPNGYEKEPIILFDPSYFVNFVNDNGNKLSFGFYQAFSKDDFDDLKGGKPITMNLINTERNYRRLYGSTGSLDDYVFEKVSPVYIYGLENAKKYKRTIKK